MANEIGTITQTNIDAATLAQSDAPVAVGGFKRNRELGGKDVKELSVTSGFSLARKDTGYEPWFTRTDLFYDGPSVVNAVADEPNAIIWKDSKATLPNDKDSIEKQLGKSPHAFSLILQTISKWGHVTPDQLAMLTPLSKYALRTKLATLTKLGAIETSRRPMDGTRSRWLFRITQDKTVRKRFADVLGLPGLQSASYQSAITDSLSTELACRMLEHNDTFRITRIIPPADSHAENLLGDKSEKIANVEHLKNPVGDFAAVISNGDSEQLVVFEIERSGQSTAETATAKLGRWMGCAAVMDIPLRVVFVGASQSKPADSVRLLAKTVEGLQEDTNMMTRLTGLPEAALTERVRRHFRETVCVASWEDWFPAPNIVEESFFRLECSRLGEAVNVLDELEPITHSIERSVPVVERSTVELRSLNKPTHRDPYESKVLRVILSNKDGSAMLHDETIVDLLLAFADDKTPSSLNIPEGREELRASYEEAVRVRQAVKSIEGTQADQTLVSEDSEELDLPVTAFDVVQLPEDGKLAKGVLNELIEEHPEPWTVEIREPRTPQPWTEGAMFWWTMQHAQLAQKWVEEGEASGRTTAELEAIKFPAGAVAEKARASAMNRWAGASESSTAELDVAETEEDDDEAEIALPQDQAHAQQALKSLLESGDITSVDQVQWPDAEWTPKAKGWLERQLAA